MKTANTQARKSHSCQGGETLRQAQRMQQESVRMWLLIATQKLKDKGAMPSRLGRNILSKLVSYVSQVTCPTTYLS